MIYLNADGMPLSISSSSSADVMWIYFVIFSLSLFLSLSAHLVGMMFIRAVIHFCWIYGLFSVVDVNS